MKQLLALILTAGFLSGAGCSSTPTKVDAGPIAARSFSFVQPPPKSQPVFNDRWAPVHTMIQDSISRNLGAKGVQRVPSGGEVIVAYLIITGDNAATGSIDDYFGVGRDSFAVLEKAEKAYSSSKNPNYFQAGTLVIDILDASSYKLLKRGYATRELLKQPTTDARSARLQEVVDEILRDVRISGR